MGKEDVEGVNRPPQMPLHLRVVVAWTLLHLIALCTRVEGANLPILKIGALFAYNSSIGIVALPALQLAVADVNANASILVGHQVVLVTADTACNAFVGAGAGLDLLKAGVLAVAGPQTSVVAQFAADLGTATQVPFISFSATDPSLTKADNPFFLRTVHTDAKQMEAIAALVGLFSWREVAAVSTNDYVGLNSLSALSDALNPLDINFVYKANIPTDIGVADLMGILTQMSLLETRVFVVHLQPNLARLFFTTASSMSMMTTGYIWIVTEAISSMLEGLPSGDNFWSVTQGVIGVRSYFPPSPELDSFQARWTSQALNSSVSSSLGVISSQLALNIYGMYAYDTVWMIARAIDTFLSAGKNFTFASLPSQQVVDFSALKVLQEGPQFVQTIRGIKFTGITGPVQVDINGDLVGSNYEVVNLIGKSPRVVGYWNPADGFGLLPWNDSNSNNVTGMSPTYSPDPTGAGKSPTTLQDIIWPGGSAQVPRGWVVAKNGEKLLIGVPFKTGFPEFVDVQTDLSDVTTFHGFCIDVFEAALSYLPYSVSYSYVAYGNGTATPNYDDLVQQIPDKVFDAVVGDVTITTKRSKIVDFTQPYTASGLVVVVPTRAGGSSHAWAFMRPFTALMWCTTGLFFLFTGLAIWILEHKKNKDFRGKPKKQLVTVLWFIFSTLFFSQREKTKSTLGRAVLIIWLFVVLIVISSYTASLTSILTVQQLLPTIQGIAGLVSSSVNIGYQAGSFVEEYLQQLNVPKERLVPLGNQTAFANALKKGFVGAIVDELPYVQQFLSSECQFTIAGQEFTKSGWGYAFPRGSQLAIDLSTAILTLAENGRLQQIHDYWLTGHDCGSSGLVVDSNVLGLSSFWGLFLITGGASVVCVVLYYGRLIWQHHKAYREDDADSDQSLSRSSRRKSFLRSLVSFIEESEVAAGARDDAIGANPQQKNKVRRSTDYGLESRGASERSEDPVLATTPEHPV